MSGIRAVRGDVATVVTSSLSSAGGPLASPQALSHELCLGRGWQEDKLLA